MLILWTIAGFILGWIIIELPVLLGKKVNIPWVFNLALGLIGALAMYTFLSDKFS